MLTEKQKYRAGIVLKIAAAAAMAASLAACAYDPYPPPPPAQAHYTDGYYSYYEYPGDYHYVYVGDDYRSSYSGRYDEHEDWRRDQGTDNVGATDHNAHNRDDYDNHDR